MATNGNLSDADLGTIPGTTARVLVALVPQTAALRAAFAHRFGKPLSVTSAYRTYAEQESLFRARFTTDYAASAKIDPRVWNGRTWWRRPGATSAATPGTSNHGWGRAIDWGSGVQTLGSAEHSWMVANAPLFGWWWPTQFRAAPYLEPWHFEGWAVQLASYTTYLTDRGITIPDLTLPPGINPQEDDMPISRLVRHPNGSIALAGDDGSFVPLGTEDEVNSLRYLGLVKPGGGPLDTVQLVDGLVWNQMARIAARKASQASTDPQKVADAIAALLVPAVVEALPTGAGLSAEQVRVVSEAAIRNVLGSLRDG